MNFTLLLTGLASGLFHSVYSAFSKNLLNQKIKAPFLLMLYINLFQALLTFLLWLFIKPALIPAEGVSPLLLAGLTSVLAYIFLYLSLSCGDVSSVMPIMGSKVIFSGFLAIFMLGEKHSFNTYAAAVLVAVSIAVLSFSPSKKTKFPLKPVIFMLLCTIVFAFTDIFIKRSLVYIDSFNFMVYYNLLLGLGSLAVIPYLKRKNISMKLEKKSILLSLGAAFSLVVSTVFLVIAFSLSKSVIVPNVLQSSRGIFIVIISAILSVGGKPILEHQRMSVYLLRLGASSLIIFSIWLVLK